MRAPCAGPVCHKFVRVGYASACAGPFGPRISQVKDALACFAAGVSCAAEIHHLTIRARHRPTPLETGRDGPGPAETGRDARDRSGSTRYTGVRETQRSYVIVVVTARDRSGPAETGRDRPGPVETLETLGTGWDVNQLQSVLIGNSSTIIGNSSFARDGSRHSRPVGVDEIHRGRLKHRGVCDSRSDVARDRSGPVETGRDGPGPAETLETPGTGRGRSRWV